MLSFGVLVNVQHNRWQVLPQPFPGVVDEIAMAGTSSNDTLLAGASTSPALGFLRHIPRTGS
ncbi:MAG: hypothetical protein HG423_006165 [Propionibacterium sp.]|nr:hypothetical protein [Propionibacterium sp.]